MAFTAKQSKWELKMIEEYLDRASTDPSIDVSAAIQNYSHKTEAQQLTFLRNWRDKRVIELTTRKTGNINKNLILDAKITDLGGV